MPLRSLTRSRTRRLLLPLAAVFVFLAAGPNILAQSIEDLSTMLQTGTVEQKRTVLLEVRRRQTPQAARVAIAGLSDADEMVRATAAAAVVYLPPDESVPLLTDLLSDPRPFVRREAAAALDEVSSLSAAPHLLQRFDREKDPEVRTALIIALGGSGNIIALPKLIAVVRGKNTADNEFLRRSAARAIGRIAKKIKTGDVRTTTPQNFLPEKFKSINVGDLTAAYPDFAEAAKTLSGVLSDRKQPLDVRRESAFAIGMIGSRQYAELLRRIHDNDPFLREICREALLNLNADQS